uniref:Uncharacterized protein n=1 Tax=Prolemur simus TaxID=1328070 RepID=A0A8C8ZVP0_PROSS
MTGERTPGSVTLWLHETSHGDTGPRSACVWPALLTGLWRSSLLMSPTWSQGEGRDGTGEPFHNWGLRD